MTDITDIHSHILPGIDDGPSSMRETMRLLKCAREQGIRRVIATPHYSARFRNDDPEHIRALVRQVNSEAEKRKIRVQVFPGQEIFYSEEIPELIRKGRLLTMADSRYVMLEFHPCEPYLTICRAVQETVAEGYLPILAHAERYEALRTAEKTEALKKKGAYMQMNYRSVQGNLFREKTRRCRAMLRSGLIDFMGTDMHNMQDRAPQTEEAIRWMKKRLGREEFRRLARGNAEYILEDKRRL